MTVSNSFLLHAVASMSAIAPISYRRIFNGYGIYHEGVQFALVINDRLYFRADEASRELYLAKRMTAFLPSTVGVAESNFFQLPEHLLTHQAELMFWMRIAIESAQGSYAQDESEVNPQLPVHHVKLR